MKPPTLDLMQRNLKALGVPSSALKAPSDDRVFDAYVSGWKKDQKSPSIDAVIRASGVPRSSIYSTIDRLLRDGRLMRSGRGEYIPNVVSK